MNQYLNFQKTYGHQIWQGGTSRRADSDETNLAVTADVMTLRSCVKLKPLYLSYYSAYEHQTWQNGC